LNIKAEDSVNYPPVPILTSTVNKEKLYPSKSSIIRGAFAITNKNKHPEATMRWVDYFYSAEGIKLLRTGGKENEVWKWSDDKKTQWTMIVPDGKNPEEARGQRTPDVGTSVPGLLDETWENAQCDIANMYLNKVSESYMPYAKEAYPLVYFSSEEFQKLNPLLVDIQTYVKQMEAKFIAGNEPLSNWDNYVSTLKKMRVEQVISIHQTAYDRWKKTK